MDDLVRAAYDQARAAEAEGNLPIGSVVVKDGAVLGAGRNRQKSTGDPTTHAELEAIRDAVRRAGASDAATLLAGATCVTTMMPCAMCAGAIIRFGLTGVIVAETTSYTHAGTAPFLERQGIRVEVQQDADCIELVERYCRGHPHEAATMKFSGRKQLVV